LKSYVFLLQSGPEFYLVIFLALNRVIEVNLIPPQILELTFLNLATNLCLLYIFLNLTNNAHNLLHVPMESKASLQGLLGHHVPLLVEVVILARRLLVHYRFQIVH
jgi:hypothetical protein